MEAISENKLQFVFSDSLKKWLIAGMILGVLCLGLTWFNDDEFHSRFWSNILHNAVFFTGIGLMAAFFIAVCITAWAGWHTLFKRVWESFAMFLLPGVIIMVIIALTVFFGWNHLYHWADPESVANDALMQGKASFLNKYWYLLATVIFGAIWYLIIRKIRTLSLEEDSSGTAAFTQHRKMRFWAALLLPVIGFSSAGIIWQWVMSLDAHWYSTLFAWYSAASWFVAMICMTILVIMYLKSHGYLEHVSMEHLHDLGKFLFAFSIFWAYLWFSQYMLIWYGNVGEETVYFKQRIEDYPVLFYGNVILNFVLPFLILIRNDTKRKYGSLGFISLLVFFGHWWDYFQMIKPGVLHTAHELAAHHAEGAHGAAEHASHFVAGFTIPGFLEIGTLIGFLCFFLFFVFNTLTKASLLPKNDPYLVESLHHHV